jgi:integrase
MRIFKPTRKDKKSGKTVAYKLWYVELRDHNDTVRRLPAFADKGQSLELGRKLEKLVACRLNNEPPDVALSRWLETIASRLRIKLCEIGLLDTRSVAANKPLAKHIDDFQAALSATGTTKKHAETTGHRVRQVVNACSFRFWGDIDATAIESHLAERRDKQTLAAQTSNYYVASVKQFCRWMVKNRRATQSPVEHLQRVNAESDRRIERRALSVDEVRLLLTAAKLRAGLPEVPGTERALVYRLALETGLRSNEIRSLTRGSFSFGDTLSTVTVEAGNSKRRRRDELPLRAETVKELKAHLDGKLHDTRAFSLPRGDEMAEMLRADLAAARAAWLKAAESPDERAKRRKSSFLAAVDDAGRVVDFHGLRHTFITNLARSGVHPTVAQRLARHSDPKLTLMRYTHVELSEQQEALALLPNLSPLDKPAAGIVAVCVARDDAPAINSVQPDATTIDVAADAPAQQETRESSRFPVVIAGSCGLRPEGLEPPTGGLEIRCSILLSYGRLKAEARRARRSPAAPERACKCKPSEKPRNDKDAAAGGR